MYVIIHKHNKCILIIKGVDLMTDFRVIRTEKMIQKAFIKLVNNEGFKKITVKQISTEAMINRQTFYQHYKDKYDLAEKLSEKTIHSLYSIVEVRMKYINHNDSLQTFLNDYVSKPESFIYQNGELILALLSINFDDFSFYNQLRNLITDTYLSNIDIETHKLTIDIISSMIIIILKNIINYHKLPAVEELEYLKNKLNIFLN